VVLDKSAATKPFERSFFEIIEKHGWHIMSVANGSDDEGPVFSYSTGIYQRLNAPELLIIGLPGKLCASIINHYGREIENNGARFEAGNFYAGFLEGFDVYMMEADGRAKSEFAIWADWYYERQPFPILQCIWPTTSGLWPWDPAAYDGFLDDQPLLGRTPNGNN